MSNPAQPPKNHQPKKHEQDENEGGNSGPNLVLIYTLMAIAFLIALAFAAAIVFPFYIRR